MQVKHMLGRLRAALCSPAVLVLLVTFALLMGGMASPDGHTALEARVASALSKIDGAGEVQVVIRTAAQAQGTGMRTQTQAVPCGALAVAEGANDPYVRYQLTQALCALLGLPSASVDVLSVGGGR